jgi:hypothetical protein
MVTAVNIPLLKHASATPDQKATDAPRPLGPQCHPPLVPCAAGILLIFLPSEPFKPTVYKSMEQCMCRLLIIGKDSTLQRE